MAEKKLNYGVQGIEDLVSDLNNSKDQPKSEKSGAIAIPSRKASGRPTVRTKGTVALNTGRQLNGIIEEALVKYFENYERKHGDLIVHEIYRNI